MSSIEIILPGDELTLDPQSSGFAHGFGLFETMRLREGRLELWEAHWQRMVHSAGKLGMPCQWDEVEVLGAIRALAKELAEEATIKLSLVRGRESSKLFIYSRPCSPIPASDIGLLMESPGRTNEDSFLTSHKTHNYLENILVLEAARGVGCYDGLRINSKGQVTEGAISNVFFYRDGAMHTPGLSSGLLPGVIREVMLKTPSLLQGSYGLDDVLSAEGVFLTNSSIGLLPVDWLQSKGEKIQLRSREHSCYERAQHLLSDYIKASAIQL